MKDIKRNLSRYVKGNFLLFYHVGGSFFSGLPSNGMNGMKTQVGLLPISKLLDGKPPDRVSDRAGAEHRAPMLLLYGQ